MGDKHIYADDVIGISFKKPTEWFFLLKKDIQKNRKRQILAKGAKELIEDLDLTDDEFSKLLGEPFCIMTKYNPNDDNTKGQFSPTISVQATPKNSVLGLWGNKTFEDVIKSSMKNMTDFLEDFRLIKEFGESKVSDKKSYEFDTSYTFKHVDLKEPLTVEMKSIKIETNKLFIDINCHSSVQAKEVCDMELNEFIKSIKIKN